MSQFEKVLNKEQINEIIDEYVNGLHEQIDEAVLSDVTFERTIGRLATQRQTAKYIRQIFNHTLGDENDR